MIRPIQSEGIVRTDTCVSNGRSVLLEDNSREGLGGVVKESDDRDS